MILRLTNYSNLSWTGIPLPTYTTYDAILIRYSVLYNDNRLFISFYYSRTPDSESKVLRRDRASPVIQARHRPPRIAHFPRLTSRPHHTCALILSLQSILHARVLLLIYSRECPTGSSMMQNIPLNSRVPVVIDGVLLHTSPSTRIEMARFPVHGRKAMNRNTKP